MFLFRTLYARVSRYVKAVLFGSDPVHVPPVDKKPRTRKPAAIKAPKKKQAIKTPKK